MLRGGLEPQQSRQVDVRLPGKGNSNSHGARPVHQIITMIKWIRTSRLSIQNSLSGLCQFPSYLHSQHTYIRVHLQSADERGGVSFRKVDVRLPIAVCCRVLKKGVVSRVQARTHGARPGGENGAGPTLFLARSLSLSDSLSISIRIVAVGSDRDHGAVRGSQAPPQRESSVLTTYWSEYTLSS